MQRLFQRDDRPTALMVTVCFHAMLFGGLMLAGEYVGGGGGADVPIEVEIIEPPPRPPEKKIEKKVEEKKVEEEKVEEKIEEQKVEKKVEKKVERKRVRKRTTRKVETETQEEAASGVNTNDDTAARTISMPGLGVGTGPPVGRGEQRRYVGTGGEGTNTGGGKKESKGTGPPPPTPMSIAAIKRRAKALNPDLDTSKLYPDAAKRRGIEGKVKVFLIVTKEGKVIKPRITKGLGHGLDKVALKLARQLKFKPAVDADDNPVADKLEWTFTFVLPK